MNIFKHVPFDGSRARKILTAIKAGMELPRSKNGDWTFSMTGSGGVEVDYFRADRNLYSPQNQDLPKHYFLPQSAAESLALFLASNYLNRSQLVGLAKEAK